MAKPEHTGNIFLVQVFVAIFRNIGTGIFDFNKVRIVAIVSYRCILNIP